MRTFACFAVAATLLASGCASYPIETTDLVLEPGGHVHVHGQSLRVKALSRGPGTLTISVLDAAGNELSSGSLGTGQWTGGSGLATDVWLRNESTGIVSLDVWAGGTRMVAVSTLAKPVEPR